MARTGTIAASAGVALALLAGCGEDGTSAPPQRAPLVEAVEAGYGGLPLEEQVHGVVRADNQVSVRPEVAAPVAEVLVRSGESVERGQLLVRLEDDELREQLRRAEADVRLADATAAEAQARTTELEARATRLRKLAADDLVSPQDLETIEAQLGASRAASRASQARVEQARATVEERRSALAKTRVRSPVTGRVGESRVEVGMLVGPDVVLFRVGNLQRLVVEVTLTERMLSHLGEGQPVVLRPRGDGAVPIEARLTRFSPFLEADSFTTVGEIDVDNADGRLLPGMFVEVRILYGTSEQATLLPTSALWEDPRSGERGVFVVEEADGLEPPSGGPAENPARPRRVAFRRVEILAEGRGSVGVAGIERGEWVVTVGQHLIRRRMLDAESAESAAPAFGEARVRPTTWQRVAALQALQREDLLAGFLDKQQRVARVLGSEIPESEDDVYRALETGEAETPAGGR